MSRQAYGQDAAEPADAAGSCGRSRMVIAQAAFSYSQLSSASRARKHRTAIAEAISGKN
jgi:hypothetical protein